MQSAFPSEKQVDLGKEGLVHVWVLHFMTKPVVINDNLRTFFLPE